MKNILSAILITIPRGVLGCPQQGNKHGDDDRTYGDLELVHHKDFVEGRPGKTWWVGSRFLRLWFLKVNFNFRTIQCPVTKTCISTYLPFVSNIFYNKGMGQTESNCGSRKTTGKCLEGFQNCTI